MSVLLASYVIVGWLAVMWTAHSKELRASLDGAPPLWRAINLVLIFGGWPAILVIGAMQGLHQAAMQGPSE